MLLNVSSKDIQLGLLYADLLLKLLDLIQEDPRHHDMGSDPDTIYRKAGVELEWATALEGLQGTVQRSSVRVLSIGIRLHLLNLCFYIIKGQTACRSKES